MFVFAKRKHEPKEVDPSQTAPGLKVLKELWDIDPVKEQEVAPPHVNTNIYAVPDDKKNEIPRRKPPKFFK